MLDPLPFLARSQSWGIDCSERTQAVVTIHFLRDPDGNGAFGKVCIEKVCGAS
jgi:hypothetical protein